MSNRLARRNLLLYLLQHGTKFISPIIVAPYLAKVLGPQAFADFILWNALVWTAVLLMEFGFYIYALNAIATAETEERIQNITSSILTAKLVLAPVALIGFIMGSFALGLAARQPIAIVFGLIAVFAYGMTLAWYFQGLQRGVAAVLLEAVPQFSQLLLVLVVVHGPDDIWRVTALQTLAATLTTTMGWILLSRQGVHFRLAFPSAVAAIRAAVPYFAERASYTLYATAAPIIITILSNTREAAFYGLAEKVNTVLTALVTAAALAFSPIVARHTQLNPPNWRPSIKIVWGITLATGAGSVVMAIVIGPLFRYFLGVAYEDAIPVALSFCVVSVFMAFQLSLSYFFILPAGRATILIRTSLIALVVSLGLQTLLVPRFGAVGSVVARAVAEFAVGIILLISAIKFVGKGSQPADERV